MSGSATGKETINQEPDIAIQLLVWRLLGIGIMAKSQIAVRIPPSLLQELNSYVERTSTSKTDVVVSAISTYLGCAETVPLSQRLAEVERRLAELEAQMRAKSNAQ